MSTNKFDYIVVGAGAAGAVIASILSYGGRFSVLLIEQGYNHNADPRVTDATNLFVADSEPDITDVYLTSRDPGLNFSRGEITRGRGWGGSTSHNYLYAARPTQTYLEGLETLFGPKFSLTNSNEIFKCLEHYFPQPNSPIDSSRGTTGPLVISQLPEGRTNFALGSTPVFSSINNQTGATGLAFQLGQAFQGVTAGFIATELIPPNDDYNSISAPETNINVRQQNFVRINGDSFIRTFTGTSYLHAGIVNQFDGAGNCRRLMIASGTRVMEVIIQPVQQANKFYVTGIKALVGDECCTFAANCGVIISAGIIDSPALLMRSGIGPHDVLKKACVCPIIPNENVGRHLIMHIGPNWHLTSTIPSTYASNPSITGFVNIPNVLVSIYPPPYPPEYDPQRMYSLFVSGGAPSGVTGIFNVDIMSWNAVPKSEGNVSIVSKDIFTDPLINLNAYSHPDDRILAREFSRRLANAINATIVAGAPLAWRGLDPSILPDSVLDAVISSDSTVAHGCGTCRMSSNPWSGVVDPDFKVFGTTNLYVCDMSIFPYHPDANPALAAMLIGYKLSNQLLFPQSNPTL